MNRRHFFQTLLLPVATAGEIQVEVMEVFQSRFATAILVHHDAPPSRFPFASWLRRQDGSQIKIHVDNRAIPATIFRVRMCFGRGLILTEPTIHVHPKNVLRLSDG